MKYKTDESAHDSSLFDKITKRYSNVRFLRKSTNRKDSQENSVTGSYDMTGRNSDDHKLEIGAPILISKTTIDTDSVILDAGHYRHSDCNPLQRNSDQSDSYHDANSSLDTQQSSFQSSVSSNDDDRHEERAYDQIKPMPLTIEVNNNGNFVTANRSKSAINLHKTELSVYLQRSPSMEITNHLAQPISMPCNYNRCNGFRTMLSKHHSVDSDNSYHNSRNSITVNGSTLDVDALDFDMKSASFQSLDARNIFLSIEELNEITRQINESDEYGSSPDNERLEYQIHRDNLKPCERRVTLLRNKNQKFLNIAPRRDKLTNAWSGFKTWIGEEKGKIKEAVNKHAAMQRVGANAKSTSAENGAATATDGVTIVNGTALQISQTVTEANNQKLHGSNERNSKIHTQCDSVDNQQRRVIGSESNESNQGGAVNSTKRKSLHEIEVIEETRIQMNGRITLDETNKAMKNGSMRCANTHFSLHNFNHVSLNSSGQSE